MPGRSGLGKGWFGQSRKHQLAATEGKAKYVKVLYKGEVLDLNVKYRMIDSRVKSLVEVDGQHYILGEGREVSPGSSDVLYFNKVYDLREARKYGGRRLPTFKGYTVDLRLREFRKMDPGKDCEWVRFDSPKGRKLLEGYNKEGWKE